MAMVECWMVSDNCFAYSIGEFFPLDGGDVRRGEEETTALLVFATSSDVPVASMWCVHREMSGNLSILNILGEKRFGEGYDMLAVGL